MSLVKELCCEECRVSTAKSDEDIARTVVVKASRAKKRSRTD